MSILITLGNLNPFTFANSIIAANLKAIELFEEPLSRVEVFHSMESSDVLQAEKQKEDGETWIDHLERNEIREKIFVHRTLEVSSTRESVEQFVDTLEPIVTGAKKKCRNLLVDLSNGTTLAKNLLANAANALNISHKYMFDVNKLFKLTNEREFIEPGILIQGYVPAPGSINLDITGKIRVLFMFLNPKGGENLNLGQEIRDITEKISAAEYGNFIEFIPIFAVKTGDAIRELNRHKPHIVHYSGHAEDSNIFLVDEMGFRKPIAPKALIALFTELKDNIRVVVFNACHTKAQAEAVTGIIDCAIGMGKEIEDVAAILFAATFYQAIAFGCSVKKAFEQGKMALNLENISGEDTPELFVKKGVDPASIYLIEPLYPLPLNPRSVV